MEKTSQKEIYYTIMHVIEAKGLAKSYNSLEAVRGIDFSIEKGECFGFLGPNGAGKTTTMSIIYCFIPPTSGVVTVFGTDVTKDPSAIKRRMGVMPQDDNLDPDLSVYENLIVYARYFDITGERARRLAGELLEFAELTEKAGVNIRKLSGGMKRRLLLARAIINDPEILMLDEPTTGLDPHSRRVVWEKLGSLKAKGATLLLTTHYMEEAERLCDRVAIMDLGKIVETDSPRALMERHDCPNLEDVYLKLTGRSLEG